MAGLGKAIAKLTRFRRRFEQLLAAAGKGLPPQAAGRLRELSGFGSNPGNLRLLCYVPDELPPKPALVVALHGCAQTAAGYDRGTGWSTLADRLGFVVIYPEQQASNNPKTCFSWFLPGDIERDRGEALSIRQMIGHAIAGFGADPERVFVTGLSAGGAMASVMLATYPEVFAGGAIIAGLPYGCAQSVEEAFAAMFDEQTTGDRMLGDRVRSASMHRGPWPRISVWHGSADPIVKPSNADRIVRQWAHVHGLSSRPTHEERIGRQLRREWKNASRETLIEVVTISGMGHGVPLAAAAADETCGTAGPFFIDVGISSTDHIARFWGLGEERAGARAAAPRAAPVQATPGAIDVVAQAAGCSLAVVEAPLERNEAGDAPPPQPLDPNAVIAAAFASAGLPVPRTGQHPSPGQVQPVAPGPIIEAALKAAGLLER